LPVPDARGAVDPQVAALAPDHLLRPRLHPLALVARPPVPGGALLPAAAGDRRPVVHFLNLRIFFLGLQLTGPTRKSTAARSTARGDGRNREEISAEDCEEISAEDCEKISD
jgi:hypothetical protein